MPFPFINNPAGKYWSLGRSKNIASNVHGTSLKILFDHSEDVLVWCPGDVLIWRPEMTSSGRPNLMFKGPSWDVDLGRLQDVLRTSPRGPSEYSNLDVPKFLLTFLSELIRLRKSIWKHFNTQGVLRTQSNF